MNEALETAVKVWLLIVGIGGAIAVAAVALYQVRQLSSSVPKISTKLEEEFERLRAQITTRLYEPSGEQIYMPVSRCEKCRTECQAQRRQDIADIKTLVGDLGRKLDELIKFHIQQEIK